MAKSKLDIPPQLLASGKHKDDNPLLTWFALRAMEAAQQRQETVQISPVSETLVPLTQSAAGFLSWVVGVSGNMVIGYALLVVLGLERSWLSILTVVVGMSILAGTLYLVVVPTLRRLPMAKKLTGAIGTASLLTMGLAGIVGSSQAAAMDQVEQFLLTAGLVAGSGCMLFGYINVYRMASELVNPLYPESPQLHIIKPYLGQILGAQEPGIAIQVRSPLRASSHGQTSYILKEPPGAEAEPETIDGQPVAYWTPDPVVTNDIWFAMFAAGCGGLSRSATLENPAVLKAPVLPGLEPDENGRERTEPEYLSRSQHDRLVQRGEARGWWRRPGQRRVPELLKPWPEIRAECEEMWQSMTGGSLPLPDYWSGRPYQVQPVVEIAA